MITKFILRFVSNGTLSELAKNPALRTLAAEEAFRRVSPEAQMRVQRMARDRGRRVTADAIEALGYPTVLQHLTANIDHAPRDYISPAFYTGAKEALQEHRARNNQGEMA